MLLPRLFVPILLLAYVECDELNSDCFILDKSLPLYDDANVFPMRKRLMNLPDMQTNNDFEVVVRRQGDNVMTDGWYEPNREYIVEVKNKHELVDFRDYLLWLEPTTNEEEAARTGMIKKENNSTFVNYSSLGTWAHLPPMALLAGSGDAVTGTTRYRVGCKGLVAERNIQSNGHHYGAITSPRFTRVLLKWIAPEDRDIDDEKNNCLAIVASVQTRGRHGAIYSNMDGLRKVICPTKLRPVSPVLPVEIMMPTTEDPNAQGREPQDKEHIFEVNMKQKGVRRDSMQPQDCCACGTATYKATFQGVWSPEKHPKDWPHKRQELLHWTNFVGASHMSSYKLFQIGQPSNAAVQSICMYGDTTIMRQTLKMAASASDGISSVQTGSQRGSYGVTPLFSFLNAPGMWTPESMSEPRTFHFAVNRTHPVFSMLSMLGPSPDWCVGVSGQSLCRADCGWINKMMINLYPWDAGVVNGSTYIPNNNNKLENPEPIKYINEKTMPNNPFTPGVPVAKLTIERVLPENDWTCTDKIAPGVNIFTNRGEIIKVMSEQEKMEKEMMKTKETKAKKGKSKSVEVSDSSSSKHKSKTRSPTSGQTVHTAGSGGFGQNNPLSEPALANMATFLCKVSDWSAWSQCSVTCGVGTMTRKRKLTLNKKNELCQHLPLEETQPCEGIRRTCDFSALCALLPWTNWSPCTATCKEPVGVQYRKRYIARSSEIDKCQHLFKSKEAKVKGFVIEDRRCEVSENECDPVAICGEGRNDGVECGKIETKYYYDAIEHKCLPFPYLGCKGNRNNFDAREKCENFCLAPVEALPAWRRERLSLLQYRTTQVKDNSKEKIKSQEPKCKLMMDGGDRCKADNVDLSDLKIKWYFSKRTNRCREFIYNGCNGNENRFETYDECLDACMPEEVYRAKIVSKARSHAKKIDKTSTDSPEEFSLSDLTQESQDCVLSKWSGWGPCSAGCASEEGSRMRSRVIIKPSRLAGKPCGVLFDQGVCYGEDDC